MHYLADRVVHRYRIIESSNGVFAVAWKESHFQNKHMPLQAVSQANDVENIERIASFLINQATEHPIDPVQL